LNNLVHPLNLADRDGGRRNEAQHKHIGDHSQGRKPSAKRKA
jgi:hypothetical protein